MEDLTDKVAVITGAGGGFGREFARRAAGHGMRLVLADVQRDALDEVVNGLRESGVRVIGEVVDVAVSRQVEHLAQRAYGEFGAVNLLMNNAGVGCGGYLWENTDNDWTWVLGVNLMGVVHGIQHFTCLVSSRFQRRTGKVAFVHVAGEAEGARGARGCLKADVDGDEVARSVGRAHLGRYYFFFSEAISSRGDGSGSPWSAQCSVMAAMWN